MFPMMQIGRAVSRFTPRSFATIRPPLHSRIGKRETMKQTNSAGMICPRLFANQTATAFVIEKTPYYSTL